MRIEGTYGVTGRDVAAPGESAAKGKPTLGAAPAPSPDAQQPESLTHESYVQQALQAEAVNAAAVAEAKSLLQSGQLDSPEAIQKAAEAIYRLGL